MSKSDTLWEAREGKIRAEITYKKVREYEFTNLEIFRVYKNKEQQWERSSQFTIDQLGAVKTLLAQAEAFIRKHELTQKWPDRPGEQKDAPKPIPERTKKPEPQPLDMKFTDDDLPF